MMSWGDRSNCMVAVSGVFLAISWVTFAFRAYVKGYIMRSFGWDDWLMVATILVFTVDSGLLIEIGRDLTKAEETKFVTYQVFQTAIYTLANVFLKLSLSITFNRILLQQWQRIVVHAVVGIHSAFGLATFFVLVFRCGNPMQFYIHYLEHNCLPWHVMESMQYTNSIVNTATDWLLTLLPIFALRSMKMNREVKTSAWIILVLGCISSTISIPRFGFIYALGGTGAEFWKNIYPVAVLGIAEVGTGIAAACLLILRPLIKSWRERGHAPSSPRMDEMDDAEFGEAKAVTIRSVSASSVSEGCNESLHKVKSIQAIVINTDEVPESPQPSPIGTEMRRRSSVKAVEVHAVPEYVSHQPQRPDYSELSQQTTQTTETGAKPWQAAGKTNSKKTPRDRKRLTWNDVHAQWSNLHASRAAYHGKPAKKEEPAAEVDQPIEKGEEEKKPKRMSMRRLTMLFPHWDDE